MPNPLRTTYRTADNSHLGWKLVLRRAMLAAHHPDPVDVLDCCQGKGLLWQQLRQEVAVRSYWGLDTKPKKGRLRVDSARILEGGRWSQNVLDVDTWGSPWRHWVAALPHIRRPTTLFLTIGYAGPGTDLTLLGVLGIERLGVPKSIRSQVQPLAEDVLLWLPERHGLRWVDALAINHPKVRYLGIHLAPERP